eukprot:scaffold28080_cov66-Phaeocystis_antarctica.AAC.2
MKGTGGGLTTGWREDGPEVACDSRKCHAQTITAVQRSWAKTSPSVYSKNGREGDDVSLSATSHPWHRHLYVTKSCERTNGRPGHGETDTPGGT